MDTEPMIDCDAMLRAKLDAYRAQGMDVQEIEVDLVHFGLVQRDKNRWVVAALSCARIDDEAFRNALSAVLATHERAELFVIAPSSELQAVIDGARNAGLRVMQWFQDPRF